MDCDPEFLASGLSHIYSFEDLHVMAIAVELGEKRWVHPYMEDWPASMKQGGGSS